MLARFFIDRPVGAWVISIVIVLAGVAAAVVLPIAQYPEITPPTVQVSCQYPGASAVVVADTVAAPIEQQVNGVEGMMYMSSQSTNDGTYNLSVTFELGTDLNMAQVLVQNRVSQATPTLPDVVKATGVTVKKKSPSVLLVVNLYSDTDPRTGRPYRDQLYLSNYATIQLKDELARIKGVGDVTLFGQQDYSMRVWLDPEKLAARELTADDVVRALQEQNVQVAAGQVGQQPVPAGQDFQYVMTTLGRLTDKEQFENIILKTGTEAQVVRVQDVARVELGAKNQDMRCRLDGKPSAGLAIFQLPGSNALQVANLVRDKMKELRTRFPAGVEYAIVYDTTPFIDESVHEVIKTLRDAIILVAIVVLLFLQDWKAMILPMIDVVVSLVGTLAVLYALGFTLNNLTLFGLVLAIGIVVDDAIVVLENIERWLAKGLPVREATIQAMGEITGPIIAITLVLSSVFLPSLFIGGITGQFYKQFALTISASMLISAINAMTLTPARAAAIFGHRTHSEHGGAGGHEALPWWGVAGLGGLLSAWLLGRVLGAPLGLPGWGGPVAPEPLGTMIEWGVWLVLFVPGAVVGWLAAWHVNQVLGAFFRLFNRGFDKVASAYGWFVGWSLRLGVIVLLIYGGLIVLTGYSFTRVPTGFIPNQDKGYLLVNVQLPDGASLERTVAAVERVETIAFDTPGVAHTVAIPGMSLVLNSAVSSNFATMFVVLKPFDERHGPQLYSEGIAAQLRKRCYAEIEDAMVAVFGPPPVDGLGSAGGFKLMVQDRGSLGLDVLQGQGDNLAEKGNQQPGLIGLFNGFRANTPQLYVEIDRAKAKTLGVPLSDIFDTLQATFGSYYVNDFNFEGRTWQVNVQGDAPFRLSPDSVRQMKVRSATGEMVPLGTVAEVRDSSGPVMVTRYNMYPAATINGASLPGVSSGRMIETMEALSDRELPAAMTFEWTELTYMETQTGGAAIWAFVGAVVLVFLVLAFLYESWSMPLAVILVVPMCLLAAVVGIALARMDINIFVQVGFVVLVGLASKNAILIVEFARERRREDMSAFDATVQASTTRLRPIIMTSFAFILGVVPLMLGHGAGAEMRRTLGVAVFSGMLGVTLFGLLLTPVFYYVIEWLTEVPEGAKPAALAATPAHARPTPSVEPASSPLPQAHGDGAGNPPETGIQAKPARPDT
ncbi:MAG: efflux RND transporter permease subunit [Gemmataceae bacterium]|nr:efflux RND transporter permease subunit [Gemmataceae bacterium]